MNQLSCIHATRPSNGKAEEVVSDDAMMQDHPHRMRKRSLAGAPCAAMLVIPVLTFMCFTCGCGGSAGPSAVVTPALPVPPAVTAANTYVGTQSPGLWSSTLDDTQQVFSYQALTYPANPNAATTGSMASVHGFLNLASAGAQSAGYAVEQQSRALLLRPGDDTAFMIGAVEQTSCFPITGNVTFQFVYLPSQYNHRVLNDPALPGYGSIVASTNTDGSAWQFGDYSGGQNSSGDASSFTGACALTNGQASITVPPTAHYTRPTTLAINQAGFILIDHSVSSPNTTTNLPEASQFGIVQPASPLVTADMVAANYTGFLYEPGNTTGTTQAMSFGAVTAGTGNSIVGGIFPNDDITQMPGTETTITLGAQDGTSNGLYPAATVTRPDPNGYCAGTSGAGVDANGNATCTFAATVVAGSADGKFALFLIAYDTTQKGLTLGIYLFQR